MVDRFFQKNVREITHSIRITEDNNVNISLKNNQTGEISHIDMIHVNEELITSMSEQLIMTGYTEIDIDN